MNVKFKFSSYGDAIWNFPSFTVKNFSVANIPFITTICVAFNAQSASLEHLYFFKVKMLTINLNAFWNE